MGYMSAPVSVPPVFDTTPCLSHLTEYEDCVIDANTNQLRFLMPSWPTLWPTLAEGGVNYGIGNRLIDNMHGKEAVKIPEEKNFDGLNER